MVASPRTDKACDDVGAGQGNGGSSFQHWQALSTHHVHVQLRHPTFQAHLQQVTILLDALYKQTIGNGLLLGRIGWAAIEFLNSTFGGVES
jgi:hypothetical protein